jgi:hypothetical protein
VETLNSVLEDVVHLTDIKEFYRENGTYARPERINQDNVPLQDVVKWYFGSTLAFHVYDTIVLLMPTNPWIEKEDIQKALLLYNKGNFNILRSYNSETSSENGLYVIDIDYLLSNDYSYDVHTGGMVCPGIEIHTEEDYQLARRSLE